MDTEWKRALGSQLGAAIDTLENAVRACPDDLWGDRAQRPEYWYSAFHAIFFVDYYLTDPAETFAPPAPFTLGELDPAGVLPERVYTRAELLGYLEHCRAKCTRVIAGLTDERARERRRHDWGELDFLELVIYTLRHVQHHAAQLNLALRRETGSAPPWVARAADRRS